MKAKNITNETIVCQMDKALLPQGKAVTRILEVTITAPQVKTAKSKPKLNLGLVIDRSGSMSGEKLHFAKQAASHLIDLLSEEDKASVVIYDDKVEVVYAPQEMNHGNKTAAKTGIQEIFSRGSTALFDGWLKGCEQAALNTADGVISRTFLLSDGLANVGLTNQDEIATHARELFQRDVSTSCFGIGSDYNEHLLEAMSNSGGGNFHYLEALSAIPLAFEREFEELISVALRDAKITLKLPEGADCQVSAGWPTSKNANEISTSVGTLYSGREQRIYFQIQFPAISEEKTIEMPLIFQAVPLEGEAIKIEQIIQLNVTPAEAEEKTASDAELMKRFALVDMADRATEALRMARAGDRAGANYVLAQSMDRHHNHMPAAMQSKYAHLSNSIDEGMNEFDFKRHHQEEYFNKRGRFDVRDYVLRVINGHLFTSIDNRRVLIDSGVPVSLGAEDEWYFMQEVHPISQGYLGVTLEQIIRLVGVPVDVLLGSDILKNYCLYFELNRQRFSISHQPMLRSRHNFPMPLLMGVPGVRADIRGQPVEMYLDTGAKLSYVSRNVVRGLEPAGKEMDFYPGLGEFETEVYPVEISLGDLVFTLRCGVLPNMLEKALLISGKQGIIGTEFFTKYSVQLDFPRQTLSLRA